MDNNLFLSQIFEFCLIPLLVILTRYFICYINIKMDSIKNNTDNEIAKKYLTMIHETVVNCVLTTNQTYVEALKKQGAFDEEAHRVAFERTLNAVLGILSEDAKNYIRETTGDLEKYLTSLIESTVKLEKQS